MFAETMKAVVTTGDGKFELREVPVPQPRPTEILIKVEACAQNHTDCEPFLIPTLFAFFTSPNSQGSLSSYTRKRVILWAQTSQGLS